MNTSRRLFRQWVTRDSRQCVVRKVYKIFLARLIVVEKHLKDLEELRPVTSVEIFDRIP
ncbi:hypothetical protein [Salinibacterium sp. PAMC 21357]|uniref:hypothetical protein n=1 Tax=Salinibacterium sp. PAMC 21357 TaxID=1112215 RepID=UPI001ED8C5A2|nr:hypothetical protein [Salinibacterium sp. PAMC 21357]